MNQLDTSLLDKSFTQVRENVWLSNTIDINHVIVRYINLPSFCYIINRNYYFSNRNNFSDWHEKGDYYDLHNVFKHYSVYGKEVSKQTLKEWENQDKQRGICLTLPCSCWSLEEDENYLMWKAYSSKNVGIRIKSTISLFVDALELHGVRLYGAEMRYGKESFAPDIYNWLFWKPKEYSNENEYRFYIIPSKEESQTTIAINPELFITEVLTSPFINREQSSEIIKMIKVIPSIREKVSRSCIIEF